MELCAQKPFFNINAAKLHTVIPAFSGLSYTPRVTVSARSQWAGNPANYNTAEVSYDQFFKQFGGVSFTLMLDRAGKYYQRQDAIAAYAYQLQLTDKLALRGGIAVGIIRQSFNGLVLFGDQIDPLNGGVNSTGGTNNPSDPVYGQQARSTVQAGMSLGLLSQNWYVGGGIQQLNTPTFNMSNETNYQLPMLISGVAAYGFPLTGKDAYQSIILLPLIGYVSEGSSKRLLSKLLLKSEIWQIGLGIQSNIQNQSSFIVQAGTKFRTIRVDYGFELPLNGIGISSFGTHEISVQFTQDKKPFLRSIRGKGVYCPTILRY